MAQEKKDGQDLQPEGGQQTEPAVQPEKTVRKTGSKKAAKKAAGKTDANKQAKREYSGWLTLALLLVLLLMIVSLWALFISGPARIHDERMARVQETIHREVPGVEGLNKTEFDYVTWQGYTDDTLYWFDATGSIITTRELSSLNYNEARKKAEDSYGMQADTVFLAYGYSGPVYQLENENRILMLDYDTLEWVYERNVDNAPKQ